MQGQRTVGITEKPELAPLDQLAKQYGFEPPRTKGLDTVEACQGILDETVNVFVGLGGNFLRAVPETAAMEKAWRKLPLTVQILTKLNRGAVIHGENGFLLPCLGRIEIDRQATGPQFVTVEDTTGGFTRRAARSSRLGQTCVRSRASSPASPRRRSTPIRLTGMRGVATTLSCATLLPRRIPKFSQTLIRAFCIAKRI